METVVYWDHWPHSYGKIFLGLGYARAILVFD